ncbi:MULTISPECIES: hypothetical protein [unclassified Spirosoma]|uniref:hypothetical protein n=1 Tax=unclassified Spirosoma TaxID=2621999 RepID=UPI0009658D10|nr:MULTISPECIES: hypothetical protein [unclassified Spirosoma]MBN8822076.1 hypothetical protein [Spirosoma sp.]OJW80479.1 MAG: hypothetical protein BGO59_33910 [Spirosoma sp. 48-14]
MKKFLLLFLLFCGLRAVAQDSSQVSRPASVVPDTASADKLLADLVDSAAAQPLLPSKMLFTQRIFWGPKGLLRSMNIAPLTPEGREKELKVRRSMLVAHQVMGFVTLAGFVVQGILGAKLYNAQGDSYRRLREAHETTATLINISYGATALLSLTAPPKMLANRKGFSGLKLHKYLALVHLTGMVATNVLAGMLDHNPSVKPYHRAVAYTTFGAFATSIIAIKF